MSGRNECVFWAYNINILIKSSCNWEVWNLNSFKTFIAPCLASDPLNLIIALSFKP